MTDKETKTIAMTEEIKKAAKAYTGYEPEQNNFIAGAEWATVKFKADLDAAIEFIEGIEAEANNNVLDCSRLLRRIKK